jgi:DNA helicase-2/ATP-dependent DNA helicase PcrA
MVLAELRPDANLIAPTATALPVANDAGRHLLAGLNREQRRAVIHDQPRAVVIAGPGTGKTEVVTRRVAWLIATRRARPREILALTFTDNAAQEMQARVDVLVPYGQADCAIHTFHAFGDHLLHEFAFELGLGSAVRLLRRPDQIVFLREHMFELGLERYLPLGDPTRFLGALADLFGRAKDEDLSVADLAAHAETLRTTAADCTDGADDEAADLAGARAELARAFGRYEELMAANGFIDHADQVALALRLLRSRPAVAADIARRFRYVLVDELQDTNRAQLELVLELARAVGNVMVVGDPDQGIYGFRGARAGNVARFESQLVGTTTIALRRNYRSLRPIVAAADRLLSVDRGSAARVEQVAHRRGSGVPVRHISFATPEAEADGVAQLVSEQISSGARPGRIAVLVRSNSETDEFVRNLRARGIDADNGTPVRLFETTEVRSLVAFVRLVADPSNSLEAYALASQWPYEVGGGVLARLLSGARRRNRSLLDALAESLTAADLSLEDDQRRRIRLMVEHVTAAVRLAATHSSGEVIYHYLRTSGWLGRLARADQSAPAAARRVARFCELATARAALLEHDRMSFLAPNLDITDPDDDSNDVDPDREAVRVLTVHRAKGLEFDTVFVCGLVDGRFPVRSRPAVLSLPGELLRDAAAEDKALAEERRLFYVAITRARNELVLTSHEAGRRGRGRRRPSVFIAEAIDAPAIGLDGAEANGESVSDVLARVLLPAAEPEGSARTDQPLQLSYSQIDEFQTCPERYRLRYDIGIPTPPHHALSYGSAIHTAIAEFHAAQSRGQTLTDDELVEALQNAWQPDGFLSRDHEDARFAAGADALRRFRAQQIASGALPAAVERPFSFRMGRDEIRGRIDRIDESETGTVITDYKSSAVADQKRADAKARDSLQLQVYALAHQAQTGSLPQRVQLHFVESGLIGSAAVDQKRIEQARQKVLDTANAIRERKFEPKPSPIACGYCPFRAICSSARTQ